MHDDGSAALTGVSQGGTRATGVRRMLDTAILRGLDEAMRKCGVGALRATLPSGEAAVLGCREMHGEAHLVLRNYALPWKIMRGGMLGFAESYMDGDFDTDDLRAVFDYFLANERPMTAAMPALKAARHSDRRFHFGRRNSRTGSRRNIAAHYDLGNAFFRLWLDAGMSYSSGIYRRPDATLEEAQQEKHARILAALDLSPGQSVLEIGCGWGSLAEAIARQGVYVTAITISREQYEETVTRLQLAGLATNSEVRFEDYRDTRGRFDAILSIEMIEAVGEDNWPDYFGTLRDQLRPGGSAVIQAITIHEEFYQHYRSNPDFIQRYIFPGGMLPTVQIMQQQAAAAGLTFQSVERFGLSYARTLADWRRRFDTAWPRIAALGFDERFRRMWHYYLTYCEVGFERGYIDVGLYKMHKPA